ncbi:MAG: hypothetical protein HQL46_12180 [Gammaproteobacteria bacterium]|nr:hypothetical protein [Gammaproteobacteria bacterium]
MSILEPHRTTSILPTEASDKHVQLKDWQIKETLKAVKEADNGDFASEKEISSFFNKWKENTQKNF